MKPLKIALIGLDTSHSIEFPRRMQAPDCKPEFKVTGLKAVSCLSFLTPFTDAGILQKRQEQLEQWGVRVTEDFDEAVADCDAIMIEINDPALHLEYFTRCVSLRKPIFLDKPLADTYENGKEIVALAEKHKLPVMSASSLRFSADLIKACQAVPDPDQVMVFGPLGIPAAGEGVIWYGVHCFEMLQLAMGQGAMRVDARRDASGVVTIVEYPNRRRGVVELTEGVYTYGGTVRRKDQVQSYVVDSTMIYTEELRLIHDFFRTGTAPLTLQDSLAVMQLLDAAVKSSHSKEPVMLQ
ncbi:MAG: Gfo/Idh/MocA family oxidoreductase [Bacillota bacterium]|nr:Gfo/Idh/MocA family oxidoreductase [Bacillota bacterium]